MRTPVALLIFNRPEITKRLVEEVIRARPPQVLVFADGPRPNHPEDAELIAAAKRAIAEAPWECEVLTNYSETNLGTKYRPATGLDWVFHNVEKAIFFEDDVLPHPSFFRFCDELLEKYEDDERVMMISGNNFMGERRLTTDSYLFSHYAGIWGWATWRRAWRHYDVELSEWPALIGTPFLHYIFANDEEGSFWSQCFDRIVSGETQTWDHQWQFAVWRQFGLSIMPAVNLCTNVGFGPTAQHYKELNPKLAAVPVHEMQFPLRHPTKIVRNREADEFVFRELLSGGVSKKRRSRRLIPFLR